MFSLIKKCLFLGLDVKHDKKKKMGDYVLEARFEPDNKTKHKSAAIYIPIDDVEDLIARNLAYSTNILEQSIQKWVEASLYQYDNNGLIRLIIVTAHEVGHFISYCLGNHNNDLADGITLMHRGDVIGYEKLTSLVFIEEVFAWSQAEKMLKLYEFAWWKVFEEIKLDSLGTYCKILSLNQASVSMFARLSMIDEFRKVSKSNYFEPNQLQTSK